MKYTGNYGLKKPDGTDVVNINDLNANMDILDVQVKALADAKVDKIPGKGLSGEDFTSAEKSKLAGIAAGATNYTHPATHSPSIIAQDANNRFVSDAEKAAWNNKADKAHKIIAGTGLSGGGDLTADRTLSVAFGTTASTACVGNDSRLSNARTPLAHDNSAHSVPYIPVINVTAGPFWLLFKDPITSGRTATSIAMAPIVTIVNRFYAGSLQLGFNFVTREMATANPTEVRKNGAVVASFVGDPGVVLLKTVTLTAVQPGDVFEIWGIKTNDQSYTHVKDIEIRCNELLL